MMINKTPLSEKPTTMSPISKVFVEINKLTELTGTGRVKKGPAL